MSPIFVTSAPPSRRSRSIRCTCSPLVLNLSKELLLHPASQMSTIGSDLQWHMDKVHGASPRARAALVNPHVHKEATCQISCRSAKNCGCAQGTLNRHTQTDMVLLQCESNHKTIYLTFGHNFGKCRPIYQILSL